MAKYSIGDLVVLKSGSMRMCVEGVDEAADTVSTVWCNEGVIGRDTFATLLLNKWEVREEKSGGGRPYGGDREGGGKPYRGGDRGGDRGGPRNDRGGDRGGDRPQKQGWDGKPREKKYYRKDD